MSTGPRDESISLARSGKTEEALAVCQRIVDPWFKVQALAYVARYSPDKESGREIAIKALAEARMCHDNYQRAAVAAWPLCALIELGFLDDAREHFAEAVAVAGREPNPASRSYALWLLIQSCFSLGLPELERAIVPMQETLTVSTAWRSARTLSEVCLFIAELNKLRAMEIALAMPESRFRRQTLRQLEQGTSGYRRQSFFH